jgi:hypothetical protein
MNNTNTDSKKQNNYRVYDRTGSGVEHDIYAESIEDAIAQGRAWIEDGCWEAGDKEQSLSCEVRPIVRDEDGEIDGAATDDGEAEDCSGTLACADAPSCVTGQEHEWESPYECVAGCKENPGVYGSQHGQVMSTSVCRYCGLYCTIDYGATDSSNGTCTTSITYRDPDEASENYVAECQANDAEGKQI